MAATGRRRSALLSVTFLTLCFVLYWGSFGNPFVNWDDYSLITQNEYVHRLSWQNLKAIFTPGEAGAYQPIRDISYAVDYAIWKDNPFGYHLTNVLFYGLTVILLFRLLLAYLGSAWGALFGALLFTVHPLHVEPIAWLSGRKDALSGFFFILSLLLYIGLDSHTRDRRALRLRYSCSLAAFVLSALSKPMAVTLPAVLVLHDLTCAPGAGLRLAIRRWKRYVPFLLVAAAVTAITILVGIRGEVVKGFHGGTPYSQLLTTIHVIARNVQLMLVPVGLSARYVDYYATSIRQLEVVVSSVLVILMGLFTALVWRRSAIVAFGVLWFAATLAPVLNLVPISTLVADRYLYLPSVGLALLAGLAFRRVTRIRGPSRTFAFLAAAAVLLVFGRLTMERTAVWSDNLRLWGDVVEKDPGNVFGHYALANVCFEAHLYAQAGNEYKRTIRLAPDFHSAWVGLGTCYVMRDSLDKAVEVYEQALNYCSSGQSELLVNLASALRAKGLYDRAIAAYNDALMLAPDSEKAQLGLAGTYLEQGDFDSALALYDRCLAGQSAEGAAAVYQSMGLAYYNKGDYDKAVEFLRQSLTREPDLAEAHFAIANCYLETGELKEAAAHLRWVLSAYPLDYRALNNLWRVYMAMGLKNEALSALQEAAAIAPDDLTIGNNLGETYLEMGMLDSAQEALERVLEDHPDHTAARLNLGCALAARGEHERAIEQYRKALSKGPESAEAYYNIACSQAQLGLRLQALANLRRAFELGLPDPGVLLDDPDLEPLRDDPRFMELVRRSSAGARSLR